jgi:hypothetical protein
MGNVYKIYGRKPEGEEIHRRIRRICVYVRIILKYIFNKQDMRV